MLPAVDLSGRPNLDEKEIRHKQYAEKLRLNRS